MLAYVARHAQRLWTQNEVRRSLGAAGAGWLIASAFVYTAAWLPSVWFWRELMRALGGRVSFADAARAYYCGHLGKYIPGKAMVIVIRSAMVKDRGCPAPIAAVTAAYETLTMMGTGVAVGGALTPLLFPAWIETHELAGRTDLISQTAITAIAVTAVVAGSLPLIAKALSWIAAKAKPGANIPNAAGARPAPLGIPTRLVAAGCAAFVVSWIVQGVSLGMTLRAVTGASLDWNQLPTWTGGMALSTSLGFAVLFAPAGLGVREGILLGILNSQPGIDPQSAVAATVLSRAVSFAAELGVSTLLWTTVRRRS